jgi:hypothetical protein
MLSPLTKRQVPRRYAEYMDGHIEAWDLGRPGRKGHVGIPSRPLVLQWHNQAMGRAAGQSRGLLNLPAMITRGEGIELFTAFLERHGLTLDSFPQAAQTTFSRG